MSDAWSIYYIVVINGLFMLCLFKPPTSIVNDACTPAAVCLYMRTLHVSGGRAICIHLTANVYISVCILAMVVFCLLSVMTRRH